MHELKEEFRKIYETSENPTEGLLSCFESKLHIRFFLVIKPRVRASQLGLTKGSQHSNHI